MLFKVALLMWFVAVALLFLTRTAGRVWIVRLFVGGFCLLLLAFFIALMRRAI
jgi:hypothetical protein